MPIKLPTVQTGYEKSVAEAAKKVGKNLRINMGPGAKSIESLARPLGRLTGRADEFTKSMEAANARVLAFGASVGVIAAVSKGLQELVRATVEVEKSLANINSILKQSESQLNSFKNEIFSVARNTGQTFEVVAEAALELSRQGLKAEEVTKRLNDALILSRLSGLSAADSVAGLTAAINSFSSAGLTSAEVLNKISAAAASAAVSDRDLIDGLKRSGSVAVAAGVKFDELIGIISALQERTARGGAVIGNSLKTIFTRIQDLDKLQTLQRLGVEVTDLGGKVLSSNKVIENLAPTFAKLDQAAKVNLADKLVGKFQIAPFLALLEDYNLKISRSGQVANTSLNATTEAYQRNEALSKTLAAAVNTATVSLKELANTLGEIGVTENLSNIIGVFNSVVSSITGILDGDGIGSKFAKGLIKGISSIIAGPGLALALVAIGKLLLDFAKFGTGALRTFFGLNKAAEAQATLQGQIAASLLNDKSVRSAILSIEKQNISEGEKKKLQTLFFTKALNEQLAVMQRMQGIARTVAPGVMAGTASRRGKRAAGGFLPTSAESSDISRGVGGAPASAKPVVIPNFAFGGGKRGTMVANDSEYIVPNYANGGDAVFNQNMVSSMGLPSNARKVRAASGYVPNFAATSLQDILRRPGNFIKADGSFTSNSAKAAYDKSTGEDRKLLDAQRNRNKNLYSYFANSGNNKTIMLLPQQSDFKGDGADHRFQAPYKGIQKNAVTFFEGGSSGIDKKLKNDKSSKGKQFKKLLTLDTDIDNAIATGVNTVFKDFKDASGNKDIFKLTPTQVTGKNVKDLMEKGGPGALGAIKGATFEALMVAITGGISQKGGEMDIDFSRDKGNILDLIFGIQGYRFGDFKSSEAQKDKFARQTLDNVKGVVQLSKKVKTKNAKGKTPPNAASGYIPNYADPLQDAIGREKAAGLPVSQIRINQSAKLRSSQNPMGLAVTNTRDEPTGAIPNFAKPKNKNSDDTGSAVDGLTTKFFVLQGAMTAFSSGLDETGGAMAEFSSAAITSAQIMIGLQAFGLNPGLGGLGGGLGKGASKLFSKLGPVTRLFSKMGPFLGKVVSGFGKFVPILGTLLTTLPLIDLGFKKFFGEGLFSKMGKAIGFIEDPALKAAKALDELSDKASGDLFQGQGKTGNVQNLIRRIEVSEKIKKPVDQVSPEELQKNFEENIKGSFGFEGSRINKRVIGGPSGLPNPNENSFVAAANAFLDLIGQSPVKTRSEFSFGKTKFSGEPEIEAVNKNREAITAAIANDILGTLPKNEQLALRDQGRSEIGGKVAGAIQNTFDGSQIKQFQSAFDQSVVSLTEGDSETAMKNLTIIKELLATQQTALANAVKAKAINKTSLDDAKAQLSIQLELLKSKFNLQTEDEKTLERNKTVANLSKITTLELQERIALRQLDLDLSDRMVAGLKDQVKELKGLNVDNEKLQTLTENINKKAKDGVLSLKDREIISREISKILANEDVEAQAILKTMLKELEVEDQVLAKLKEQTAEKFEQLKLNEKALQAQKDFVSRMNLQTGLTDQGSQSDFRKNIRSSEANIRFLERDAQFATPDKLPGIQRQIISEKQILAESQFELGKVNTLQKGRGLIKPLESFIAEDSQKEVLGANSFDKLIEGLRRIESVTDFMDTTDTVRNNFSIAINDLIEEERINREALKDNTKVLGETRIGPSAQIESLLGRSGVLERAGLGRRAFGLRQKADVLGRIDEGGDLAGLTEEEATAKIQMSRGVFKRIGEAIPTALENSNQLNESLKDASLSFAHNIGNAMLDAIEKGENLGDILLGVASEFLSTMSRAFMKSAVDDVLGSFGIGKQGGGPIRGGSGTKDDVPAMLMGGEFVMNKKAVRKYGVGFMSSLNSGSMQGFRSGGQVRDREGMFTTPGMNGAGAIVGAGNLLSFATQTPIAMGRDTLTSNGAFLDPESGRLSMFGRRSSPQFQQVQGAKQQAFDLYASQVAAEEQAIRQKKESRKQLMKSLAAAAASVVVGAGVKSMASGFKAGFSGTDGSFGTKFGAGLKGSLFGGNNIAGQSYGGLSNLFTGRGFQSGPSGIGSGFTPKSASARPSPSDYSAPVHPTEDDLSGLTYQDLYDTDISKTGYLPNLPPKDKRATGGLIPAAGGVDTVPAMLSGGEFVMNAAATRNIGAGNLQALNSGAGTGDNTNLVAKLDELIIATETSQSTGDINITINGSNGAETETQGQNSTDQQKALSDKIKTAVKQVIADEKRLGGQLRR